jgi:hypothetical protein
MVPRLEYVRESLSIKARKTKHHRNLWPRYLQLLDADLDGRTLRQIADALAHEEEAGLDEGKV